MEHAPAAVEALARKLDKDVEYAALVIALVVSDCHSVKAQVHAMASGVYGCH